MEFLHRRPPAWKTFTLKTNVHVLSGMQEAALAEYG